MSVECIFCKIISNEIPSYKVYEDEKTLAFLDIHPSAPGHTLIIPKHHIARIEDLSEAEARSLFKTLHFLVGRIQKAMEVPACTIGINNGRESGQEIPHVHIHVIPRSKRDRGGIIQGIIQTKKLETQKMAEIADRIKVEINQLE